MLAESSQNARVFTPSEIKRQEKRRGSVEESLICPIDRDTIKATVKIEPRALHCILGAGKIDENRLAISQC